MENNAPEITPMISASYVESLMVNLTRGTPSQRQDTYRELRSKVYEISCAYLKLHEENQRLNELIGVLKLLKFGDHETISVFEENQRLYETIEYYAKLFKHLKIGHKAREALNKELK